MKTKQTKSAVVRGLLAAHPKASVQEIIDFAKAEGVAVKKQTVYFIKSTSKRKRKVKVGLNGTASNGHQARVATVLPEHLAPPVGIASIVAAVADIWTLAVKVGGIRNLKAIVDVMTARQEAEEARQANG